jgi:tetratricopeptide (TPR) repeat protein
MVKNLLVPWMRRTHLRARSVSLGLCLLLGVGGARAQAVLAPTQPVPAPAAPEQGSSTSVSPEQDGAKDQAAREEAATRFQRGLAFYGDGDFALALIEFDRAYQLVPDYRVLYNIGQVSIQLSRFARARLALEQYLAEGGAAIPPERMAEVERDLRMLGDRTAYIELTVSTLGAEVLVDDRSQGETPLGAPLLLDAGEHQVVVRKEGFQTATRRVVLAGSERLPLAIELVPLEKEPVIVLQKPEPVPSQAPAADKVERRGPDPAVFAWIGTGVLAAAAATTGILGLDAKGRYDQAMLDPDNQEAIDAAASDAKAFFLAFDILAVSTAAACGTSLYLTLHKPKAKETSATAHPRGTVELGLLPHAVHLRGSF